MGDVEPATVKLAELLRHPDDLEKIPGLKAEFNRKKAAVDGQLRHGLKDQLELTQAGMTSITDGQRTVNLIKEEMMKIDKLCAEAQNMIHDFPHINLVAQTHKNFESVEKMRRDIETFEERLENLEYLLAQDDEDPANQPNLLEIHYGLTQLRDIRDEAMAQIKGTEDASTELIDNLALENGVTVQDLFARLDDVVDWFDKHIGEACINLIELVQTGNDGMVVRLAVVIEEEEKTDKKVKALQDAQREYKDLASRFKSIAAGPKELRGYKDKFIQAIEYVCQANIEDAKEKFNEDPEKIEKYFKWYFNNLNTVKLGMVTLMPKKWKILQTYGNIYHKQMHDLLVGLADDEGLGPQYLLAVINWVDKYYAKMGKLGFSEDSLQPHVVDNRAPELIRTYRQVIISAVDQYMDRLNVQDKKYFLDRDETAYDRNADGIFQTKTLGDVWSMLNQNLSVAASSDRSDVAEGVVDAMFAALRSRQRLWESLIETERDKYASPNANQEGAALLQDWLIAIANDQIICIDEENAEIDGRVSFLSSFEKEVAPLVSPAYSDKLEKQLDELRNGYLDLSTKCIEVWSQLMFYTDFRPILAEFFTPTWYSTTGMASITITFSDYLNDYEPVLHPSLRDFLVDNLANELLIQYLSAIRNRGVKIKRSDPFTDKVRDDVIQVFEFFGQYPSGLEVKEKWRAANFFLRLLESEKALVPAVYEEFKMSYWDVQIGWVEAVLRSRDDFERSMLNAVKAKAAETIVEPGPETIMSRVK